MNQIDQTIDTRLGNNEELIKLSEREDVNAICQRLGYDLSLNWQGYLKSPAHYLLQGIYQIERQRSNGHECFGRFDNKCSYLAACDKPCNKCGNIHTGNHIDRNHANYDFTAPKHSPIPQAFKGMPLLNADEISLLRRFVETTEDDSSYDLSPEEVQRLAKYGALRHNGGGHYSITEFGKWLSAAPSSPIEAQQSVTQALEKAIVIAKQYVPTLNLERKVEEQIRALIPSTQAPDKP